MAIGYELLHLCNPMRDCLVLNIHNQALQQHSFRLEVTMLRQPIRHTIQQLSRQTLELSLRATTQDQERNTQDHNRQDRYMQRSKLDKAGLQSVTSNAYKETCMAVASSPDDLLF